jgi:hypothetical protein
MLVITILNLSWGPNDLYAFLRYFFDSVIRDYALNIHEKWLSMLRSHSHVTYSIGILYFDVYGVDFYAGYNHTKLILGTEWFICVFALFLWQCNTRLRLNFHAKWLSMLRSHSHVTYSIGILYFNICRVEFYAGCNHTKIILATEWLICVFSLFLWQCNTRLRN